MYDRQPQLLYKNSYFYDTIFYEKRFYKISNNNYNNCCLINNIIKGEIMLDVFITSRVRRKIIVVYAKFPDFKTHVRGLAKLIKEDAGNIQRELKRLEKVGFLVSEKQGNTKIYSTNKNFPIFKELQGIVLKSQRASQKGSGPYNIKRPSSMQ